MNDTIHIDPIDIITDPRFIKDRDQLASLIEKIYNFSGKQPLVLNLPAGQVVFGLDAAKLFALQAENARLREALEQMIARIEIIEGLLLRAFSEEAITERITGMIAFANAALKGDKP